MSCHFDLTFVYLNEVIKQIYNKRIINCITMYKHFDISHIKLE